MVDAIRMDNSPPTLSSRNLALLHTAVYDAVNSVLRTHQPYRFELAPVPETSAEAAAVAAAYEVAVTLYPGWRSPADARFTAQTQSLASNPGLEQGLALGKRIAQLALESRKSDGSSTDVIYVPRELPGEWRRTPPFFRPPTTPGWRYVELFALSDTE